MVVILGRTGRTERSFPATAAGVVVNVGLNLWLVPDHGIIGAAVALVLSYVVVVGLMYGMTRNLFPVPYEWRRLALIARRHRGPDRDRRDARLPRGRGGPGRVAGAVRLLPG